MEAFYRVKQNSPDLKRSALLNGALRLWLVRLKTFFDQSTDLLKLKLATVWISMAVVFVTANFTYSFSKPAFRDPGINSANRSLSGNRKIAESKKKVSKSVESHKKTSSAMAPPQGAFPLQRGMAIMSRLSNPYVLGRPLGAPGPGSISTNPVLTVIDTRAPGSNGAVNANGALANNWTSASAGAFSHSSWTNASMGEIFGIEIDNSVRSAPQVFAGSTGSFVGGLDGAEYPGHITARTGSSGGDVFRIDGNTGTATLLTSAIPSTSYSSNLGFQRYSGVGNIGYNSNNKVVYTCALDNGNIYAINATTGAFIGSAFNHLPGVTDPTNLAMSDARRLVVGIAWNPRDNRLYFARITGYNVLFGTNIDFTGNEIVSVGLNSDGSINGAAGTRAEYTYTVVALGGQKPVIADIEFSSNGNTMILAEMTVANAFNDRQYRFTKGSHNANTHRIAFNGLTWFSQNEYKTGVFGSRDNGTGGADIGFNNMTGGYGDAVVMTGDYLTEGPVYGIQISPIGNGGYPSFGTHYVTDGALGQTGVTWEKTAIGDVDVFSGPEIVLSGTVFNDANGLNGAPFNMVDGVPIQSPSGTPLQANLFTAAGVFVATTPIDASGNYVFATVTPSTFYQVTISSAPAAAGSTPAGSVALPPGWVNTGENVGLTAGSDGTVNGILLALVGTTDRTDVNFGIEQVPETAVNLQPVQVNPGGTANVQVPASAFVISNVGSNPNTSDPVPGGVTGIKITGFPTNATSITINGTQFTSLGFIDLFFPNGIPVDASGQPTVPITVDPVDGAVSVVIPIAAVDAAGKQDPTPGSITLPFATPVSLSGTVFHDVNGLNPAPDNTVDGIPIQSPSGTPLHANLFTGAGVFVATTPIDGSGNYVFNNITPSSAYQVTISTAPAAGGSTPAGSVGLPATWVNTGENVGLTAGSDGSVNGILQAVVGTVDLPNVNFGIEQGPETAVNLQASQLNPGGTTSVTVPADAFVTSNVGANPNTSDPAPGAVTGIVITGFPTNATSITIDGVAYTTLPAIQTAYPDGIPTDASGQPTVPVLVDPVDGAVSVVIPIAAVDAAGIQDATPGSITLPFTVLAPISLSGTVFHDVNGLNPTPTNTVDGVPIQSPSGTPLHANLFTGAGVFVATTPIDGSGNYVFNNITPSSTYQVTISTTPAAGGSTPAGSVGLPATWVNTGENVGLTAGSDGSVNGILQAVVGTVDLPNVNFGIQQIPDSDNKSGTVAAQPIPDQMVPLDGTVVTAPPLTGSDAEDQPASGTLSGKTVAITSLPTKGELWYGGVQITLGDDGLTPVSAVNPFTIANLVPSDLAIKLSGSGYTSTSFTYAYVDAAGFPDPTPATYVLDWADPLPVTLVGFTAAKEGASTQLAWSTTEEVNSDYFEIQRSSDGKNWSVLDQVSSAGESRVVKNYSYADQTPAAGKNLYRLRMVDTDGSDAFSTIQLVDFGAKINVALSPNPVSDQLKIELPDWNQVKQVRIFDAAGKQAYSSGPKPTNTIDVLGFPSGTYLVAIENKDGSVYSRRVVVIR
jgi:hypothetical protein